MQVQRLCRMFKFLTLCLLGFAFWILSCDSVNPEICPTTKIFGNAYNQLNSSSQIANVLVRLAPGNTTKLTDSDGYFEFDVESGNRYTLTFEKEGFENVNQSIAIDCSEGDRNLDAIMEPIQPILIAMPLAADFGSSNTTLPIEIRNEGKGILDWQIAENVDWLSINPLTGSTESEVSTLVLTVNRGNLPNGEFSRSFAISSNGGSQTIDVSVSKVDQLEVSPLNLDFGTSQNQQSIFLRNLGVSTINYSVLESLAWLTVSPVQGSLDNGIEPVSISIDRNLLTSGTHTGNITITSNVNSAIVDVSVEVE
ncbi:MAG: BACON domain-containing protein [Calditrichia bacterium]